MRGRRQTTARRLPEAHLFELTQQEINGAFHDHAKLASGIRVAQEIATKLELVAKLGAGCEFDAIARFRKGCDVSPFVEFS